LIFEQIRRVRYTLTHPTNTYFHSIIKPDSYIEDEGLVLAMMEVKDEVPLNLDDALAELEKE
jgi:RelB Antitoxin alpha helical domain